MKVKDSNNKEEKQVNSSRLHKDYQRNVTSCKEKILRFKERIKPGYPDVDVDLFFSPGEENSFLYYRYKANQKNCSGNYCTPVYCNQALHAFEEEVERGFTTVLEFNRELKKTNQEKQTKQEKQEKQEKQKEEK